MKYSAGFRNAILRKVLPPESRPIGEVSKESGVSLTTLQNWIEKARKGILDQPGAELSPQDRMPGEKMKLLLESRKLSDEELGSWLRDRGLHSEHLNLWEQELVDIVTKKEAELKAENFELKKRARELEKELRRKEKALAETAALLTLKKKAQALWGDLEDD
jgi:transposase-like protein